MPLRCSENRSVRESGILSRMASKGVPCQLELVVFPCKYRAEREPLTFLASLRVRESEIVTRSAQVLSSGRGLLCGLNASTYRVPDFKLDSAVIF